MFGRLPDVRLIVLAIRPSPAGESIRDIEAEMNSRFREIAEEDERIEFVSGSWDRFLDAKGEPIPGLYVEDKLHMSADELHILDIKENFMGVNHYYTDNTVPSHEDTVAKINQIVLNWQ